MSVITVIGAGMMGSAMSFPASDNGHEVRLVGTMLDRDIIWQVQENGFHPTLKRVLPAGIKPYQLEELEAAIDGTDVVIGGVSSFGVDWFASEVLPVLPAGLPVLSVTKGMQNEGDGILAAFPDVYKLRAPGRDYCAIGGPCTSYELADRVQTHVCFCGSNMPLLRGLRDIFHTAYYHISLSDDVTGVECAVALKNVYALAVTLAAGMAQGEGKPLQYNSQAALFGQSIAEMRKLLHLFGGGADNIVYGAGDLYVTVFGGRTRLLGSLLGQGISYKDAMEQLSGTTLESVAIASRAARAVREKIEMNLARAADFPLLLHIDEVISNGAAVSVPWDCFQTEK